MLAEGDGGDGGDDNGGGGRVGDACDLIHIYSQKAIENR